MIKCSSFSFAQFEKGKPYLGIQKSIQNYQFKLGIANPN
jgi:hypothetical protein